MVAGEMTVRFDFPTGSRAMKLAVMVDFLRELRLH